VLFSTLYSAQTQPIQATINASETDAPISKYIHGQFLEHIGGIVNNGKLEKLAEGRGLWLCELALTELTAHSADEIILAEVLALRTLFLNTVQALGKKGEVTMEQLRKLIERVDREKQGRRRSC
jgi:hypothetical protein